MTAGFPLANTNDETINGYFATANYLDTAVQEFFNYLKKAACMIIQSSSFTVTITVSRIQEIKI